MRGAESGLPSATSRSAAIGAGLPTTSTRCGECFQPDDFVIASGVAHSLEEFVATAFDAVGLNWQDHVAYDSSLVRPSEIMYSLGDPSKAAQVLHWSSTVKFPEIVARMVHAEREGADSIGG